ncbi:hypothetical protein HXA34_19220 [Salipaludibacillus agaradhaerens]|uniref:immunoglobulin-like domain-containing protein n=1 Tax=Salipaludibacillus agaradhaerens TaxID=76935 RepID=UPI0021518194|nr:immunoglobulin-like domain-containing protein [Salipaludibacillus agaradhaerens]MCR6108437.1 hypothetical protein [Salipaludibacillus agaradhaerens]MCR6120458.1 hypothetical protein [Salipaludibacillus agaradhaerens]
MWTFKHKKRLLSVSLIISLMLSPFIGTVYPSLTNAEDESSHDITLVKWDFDDETPVATGGIESNLNREISLKGASLAGYVLGFGDNSRAINSNRWNTLEDSYWLIDFTTVGFEHLTVSSKQYGSNTGPRDFEIQYSLDNHTWLPLPHSNITVEYNWFRGQVNQLSLPAELNNRETVFLRWLKTSEEAVGSGHSLSTTGSNRIDDIIITGRPIDEPDNRDDDIEEIPEDHEEEETIKPQPDNDNEEHVEPSPDEEPPSAVITSIKTARSLYGQEITIEGIANSDGSLFSQTDFSVYIQDDEAGIHLFNEHPDAFPTINEGDLIRASGIIDVSIDGIVQLVISQVDVIEENQPISVKTIDLSNYQEPDLWDAYDGQLIIFTGYLDQIDNTSQAHFINEELDGIDVRAYDHSSIDLYELAPHHWYTVTAIFSKKTGSYEAIVRRTSDILLELEQPSAPLSDKSAVDMDAEVLEVIFQGTDSYDRVLQNVILETTGRHGSSIVWYSPRPTIISSTGHVTNPINGQVPVPLTAIISKGNFQKAKSFLLIVKPIHHEVVPPFSPVPIPVLPEDSYDDETPSDSDEHDRNLTFPIYEDEDKTDDNDSYPLPSNTEERAAKVTSPIITPSLPFMADNEVASEAIIKTEYRSATSNKEPEVANGHSLTLQRATNSDVYPPETVHSQNNNSAFEEANIASIIVAETVVTIEGEKSTSRHRDGLDEGPDSSTKTLTEQTNADDLTSWLHYLLLACFLSLLIATGAIFYFRKRTL